jgi:hypothetical protein
MTKPVIRNRCATSWYQVCREFLLEIVFKYNKFNAINILICHYIKSLKYLCTSICAFRMYAAGYEVYY